MCKQYDAVLFDFDGTIADTGKGIFNGIYYALNAMGIAPPEADRMRFFIGPPLQVSFQTVCGFDEETCSTAIMKYREYYSVKGIFELELYDGMEELLRNLKAKHIKTGVASSKPELFLKKIINNFKMDDFFDVVSGSDISYVHTDKTKIILKAMERLELPAGANVLMVGDRSFDIKGAKNAGIDSVGVLFGYGSREEFVEAGADYMVEKPYDVLEIVKGSWI